MPEMIQTIAVISNVVKFTRLSVAELRHSLASNSELTFSHLNFLHLGPTDKRDDALQLQRPYFHAPGEHIATGSTCSEAISLVRRRTL